MLRVLQTGEFERLGSSTTRKANVRVISATNTDLKQAIRDGVFREDLFYRLNVIELFVPALAERPEDVLPLARYFLDEDHSLTPGAERALRGYAWPGNVRELQNCIKRACLLASESQIDVSTLGLEPGGEMPKEPDESAVRNALDGSNGVVAKAARTLGISRQALYRRMQKYGIEQTEHR